MGRSSRKSTHNYSLVSESENSESSIDAESVVKNERVYLHIYDYEAREYTGLTTYHGMVRIYNSTTWPSRIFWCVVVVSCLSLFMIHSGIMLYSYHLKPTLTQVTVVVPDGGIPFPDVTVCDFSPVLESKLESWNMSDSAFTYLLELYGIELSENTSHFYKDFISYKEDYHSKFNKSFDVKEFFEDAGPNCEDLIKICYFSGELIEDCCSLTKPVMTDYGKCFTFSNENKTRKQWFSGLHHGMEIILNSNYKLLSRLPLDPFVGVAAKVHLHESSEIPPMKSNGISVPPGMTLYGGITVQKTSLLPKTNWGRCQPDWDHSIHGEKFLKKNYSATHCELNCKIISSLEKCGCVPLHLAFEEEFKVCDPEISKSCVHSDSQKSCNCSVECEKTEYLTQVSYSNIKFSQEEISLIGEDQLDYAKENYVGILLYMKEMSYEHHEQQRQVQTADLLSNIAGSMGLFLGMSTITLLEIFIFLFKSIWGTVNTERQKQFVKSVIQQDDEKNDFIVMGNPDDEVSLAHSDTEETFKDQEPLELNQVPVRRKSTITRTFPRKSLSIVIDEDRRPSVSVSIKSASSLQRKQSIVSRDIPRSRKMSRQHHALTIDPSRFPKRSSYHTLSAALTKEMERRPSSTDLFRQSRRLSVHPLASTVHRRPSTAILSSIGRRDNPRLSTPYGEVEGFYYNADTGKRMQIFLGVPFAQAGRFEKPKPYSSWTGIRPAKEFGKACFPIHLSLGTDNSEDCLHVNIIKPEEQPDDLLGYPVLVFIYGGGFIGGFSSKYGYKSFSDYFASEKILVISVQYRVGFLGFLSTGDENLPGNLGLWDLAFALQFIRDLLPQLQGNPDDITVFGQSAGAAAAHGLSISPHTNHLFQKVIQSSGSLFGEWAFNEQVVENSLDFAEALGCDRSKKSEIPGILKAKSISEMLEAVERTSIYKSNMRQFIFNPRFDGDFFPEPLEELTRKAEKKPVLFGVTEAEWSKIVNTPYAFYNSIGLKEDVRFNFSDENFIAYIDEYIFENSNDPEVGKFKQALANFFVTQDPKTNLKNLVDIVSDMMFVLPIIYQILLRNKIGDESFLFYEKHSRELLGDEIPLVPGAPHANELFYFFKHERVAFEFDEDDLVFQKNIIQGCVSFIKTGKPSSGSIQWPTVGDGTRHVSLNPGPKVEETFEEKRMGFWINQLPKIVDIEVLRKTRLPFAQTLN